MLFARQLVRRIPRLTVSVASLQSQAVKKALRNVDKTNRSIDRSRQYSSRQCFRAEGQRKQGTLSMNVHRLAASAMVRAPAKLNLFFEVLAKRSDGFHEIETLMVPISLCDTLVAARESTGARALDCRWARPAPRSPRYARPAARRVAEIWPTRAVELLRTRAGVDHGFAMQLVKRIPSAAGLGGGSSDAAAALLAANAVWNLGWSRQRLGRAGRRTGQRRAVLPGHAAAGRLSRTRRTGRSR